MGPEAFCSLPEYPGEAYEGERGQPEDEQDGRVQELHDDDRDGATDEDGAEDLNGDGLITTMRVQDPAGEWMMDPVDGFLMRRASASPCCPVQALALPEQTTMPRATDDGSRCRQTCTGAAQTRFCVKTPAAAAGRSLTTRARSSRARSWSNFYASTSI